MIFFEKKLLLQPDVVFDSESNGCNFSSLAPPGGKKKIFFYKMTSRVGVGVYIFFSTSGGARELKLQPFDSESKTTSGCSNGYTVFNPYCI